MMWKEFEWQRHSIALPVKMPPRRRCAGFLISLHARWENTFYSKRPKDVKNFRCRRTSRRRQAVRCACGGKGYSISATGSGDPRDQPRSLLLTKLLLAAQFAPQRTHCQQRWT